jgi:hypothetical protein
LGFTAAGHSRDTSLQYDVSYSRNGSFWLTKLALERLHLLKKDASQIGINAREAVKFLDRLTSAKDGLSMDSILLQGPDEQYASWKQVEEHILQDETEPENGSTEAAEVDTPKDSCQPVTAEASEAKTPESAGGALSQMLLNKLNFVKEGDNTSNSSSLPTSPISSGPQSSKTSPEVKSARLTDQDASLVPPALKPLINSVVWYTYQKPAESKFSEVLFLTNAAETSSLARSFGVMPKNIHQLRAAIGIEDQEVKNHSKYEQKQVSPRPAFVSTTQAEPKPLFQYDEDSEEEVLVFKPRGRGVRGTASGRGSAGGSLRGRTAIHRSPVAASSATFRNSPTKPEIPVEQIDPDSFDRGSFRRGQIQAGTSNGHAQGQMHGFYRGAPTRGNFHAGVPARGGFNRGAPRGFDRGLTRGRGRLFVP